LEKADSKIGRIVAGKGATPSLVGEKQVAVRVTTPRRCPKMNLIQKRTERLLVTGTHAQEFRRVVRLGSGGGGKKVIRQAKTGQM